MEKNLGHATAYGYAKSKGYSGTEDEFAQLMADYASVGQSAAQSAEQAAASATSASGSAATAASAAQAATSKASEAVTAAGTATTKASEASQSATSASQSAESAGTSAQTATTAATTATTKASEASESATTATAAKTDAETARDAAVQSASEAAASAESIDPDEFNRKIYAAFATDTATGAIASFTDGADDIPMKDVLVHIEPVQEGSGDPSPDNICPITGWTGAKVTRCGKNLFANDSPSSGTIRSVTYTKNQDGSLTLNGTVTGGNMYVKINGGYYSDAVEIPKSLIGQQLTISGGTSNVAIQFIEYTATGTGTSHSAYDSPVTITVKSDTKYFGLFVFAVNNTVISNATVYPMTELGSTATAYEPYSGQTYDITFPSEAGTIYGGTLDVTTGELVVDRVAVVLDGSNITVDGKADYGKYIRGIFGYKARMPAARYNGSNTYVLADKLTISYEYTVGVNASKTASGFWVYPHSSGLFITMMRADYPSIASINAWLAENTPTVCYELATPITYQLTPQEITSLLGTNNLWADTGDSEVEYRADTKLYITKKITEAVSALS